MKRKYYFLNKKEPKEKEDPLPPFCFVRVQNVIPSAEGTQWTESPVSQSFGPRFRTQRRRRRSVCKR